MHKDFHLYGTYLAARFAGATKEQAQLVACAAQGVDDYTYGDYATCQDLLPMISNKKEILETYWPSFHFLPGGINDEKMTSNQEKYATKPSGFLYEKLHKDIYDANDKHASPEYLAKLGVTLHVLADTYAHSGFSGIPSDQNTVSEVVMSGGQDLGVLASATRHFPVKLLQFSSLLSYFGININSLDPAKIGHGTASHAPDLSWINWVYKRGKNKTLRSNPIVFASAFTDMYRTMGGITENEPVIYNTVKSTLESLHEQKLEMRAYIKIYSEESDNPFASILMQNRFSFHINNMNGISEKEELDEKYTDYMADVIDLSKKYNTAEGQMKELCYKKLMNNDFFHATVWHRVNVFEGIHPIETE